MTTTELKRIEALLKQWEDRATASPPGEGHDLMYCVEEMKETLQGMTDTRLHDDTMQRLSKFLYWQQGKMDSENYAMEYFEERRQESLKELEAKSKNPPT